jgi:caa(3)-type oxidase subunit IV
MGQQSHKHHHHILPTKVAVSVGLALFFLTAVTVWIAHIDLGRFNFFIAMAVATCKALLVALFFMNLKYDRIENGVIFGTSFLFLAIFIILASADLFFRGDVYVKGPLVASASTKSKLKNPWVSTPELVAKGKELFKVQCTSCHGETGQGDGAAASALNPKPRNFHVIDGWKNGRKVSMIFKTLKEGIPGSAMASYSTLSADDRWALSHYVASLNPTTPEKDTPADFAKIGIDPSKPGGGATEAPTIPVLLAMSQIMVPETQAEEVARMYHPELDRVSEAKLAGNPGAQIYQEFCVRCHGAQGQGGIKRNLGANPVAFVTTEPFKSQSDALRSSDAFSGVVIRGMPGGLMPGVGVLSSTEMNELYQFVKSLAK